MCFLCLTFVYTAPVQKLYQIALVACWRGEAGARAPLRRAFKGAPMLNWGTSYEAGKAVEMLSFVCHSPIILTKNDV